MKNLKKFIKKVYLGEAKEGTKFCEKEGKTYTVRLVETDYYNFMFISEHYEHYDPCDLLDFAVVYNEEYFAIMLKDVYPYLNISKVFEGFHLQELSYDEFLRAVDEKVKHLEDI